MESEGYRNISGAFFLLLCLTFVSNSAYADEKKVSVFVSILPQVYFLENIGGDRVAVDVFVLPGKNPATYAPTPAQISKLSKSDIYFRIGLPFEKSFIPKIRGAVKNLKIIDTRENVPLRKMKSSMDDDHGHHAGHSHHHDHGGYDPHIWLSPVLVKIQAKTILDALVNQDPEGEEYYKKNYESFIKHLDGVHQKILTFFQNVQGKSFFVFHPSFGYFADTYGLKQIAIEIEGKAPKGRDLSMFIKKAKEENVHILFVQPQFDKSAARKIAIAIDGVIVPLDPLDKDYMLNLESIAQKVAGAIGTQSR